MMLAPDSALLTTPGKPPEPESDLRAGDRQLYRVVGDSGGDRVSFGLMAFTTFVYDTLDVCPAWAAHPAGIDRCPRCRWQMVGDHRDRRRADGVPDLGTDQRSGATAWKTYWNLFGASNQLLAALTLVGVTVWLWRTYSKPWVFLVTVYPRVHVRDEHVGRSPGRWCPCSPRCKASDWSAESAIRNPVPWVATVLVSLGAMIFVEAIVALASRGPGRTPTPLPATA